MLFNNGTNRQGTTLPPQGQPNPADMPTSMLTPPALGWKDLAAQRTPPKTNKKRRRIVSSIIILLIILLIFATVRLTSIASSADDQLVIHIGDQQAATLDLRQTAPISPYAFGVNVFPKLQSTSVDKLFSGFMDYSIAGDLQNAHINLLRYPGGNWGEDHVLSLDQLGDFSALLQSVGAEGMVQAHLGTLVERTGKLPDNSLANRANQAGRWVDFMNTLHSSLRVGNYAHAPYHPVFLWSVGNEPDRRIDPLTGKPYLVSDYVNAFIEFSKFMHQNDPRIQVYGPEISQFYGLGAGPFDANGQLWMEDFLKGVGAYEKAHHVVLLDGVSFHRYPFTDAGQSPNLLLSSTDEWDYLLPPLRQLIRQDLGRDVRIAITEINTNPKAQVPSRGVASLWWADTLGTLLNQQVDVVTFFSAQGVDTPYPFFTINGQQEVPTPMLRVMELFSHLQHNLVPLQVQHEPVSVYATQDDSHQTVSLLFINKSADTHVAQISPQNQLFSTSPWHSQDVTLAPYSIVLITLHRGGDAEAYSFIEPSNTTTSTPLVIHTACGHKSDQLINSIPC